METLEVLGVPVHKVNMDQALSRAITFIDGEGKSVIFTPNSEIVMMAKENEELLSAIKKSDMIIPDGIGLVLASKIMKSPLSERVTGIDLMEKILKYCDENKKSIYILGGKPGVSEKALENIGIKYPNINTLGSFHGYFKGHHIGQEGHTEEIEVLNNINALKPDVLFVAFGAPKQELWIDRFKEEISAKLFIGVGGSVDVYAGTVKRAPMFYQKTGLEWFYRLAKEPWRYKRMMMLPKFVIEVLKAK